MKKIIGFTGTRDGGTEEQNEMVRELLTQIVPLEAHHGDCDGADEMFHGELIEHKVPKIVIHPGFNTKGEFPTRSYCDQHTPGDGKSEIIVLPAKPYLVRDIDIVKATEMLIAVPNSFSEKLRSGTWTTVRAARRENKPIIIIFPDGKTQTENS